MIVTKYLSFGWWFRNPANQLRLVVYPIIYKVLYIQAVVGNGISEPSTMYGLDFPWWTGGVGRFFLEAGIYSKKNGFQTWSYLEY